MNKIVKGRFKKVPGYSYLWIHKDGRVYDGLMDITHQPDRLCYEYPAVNINNLGTLHIHRLLALTFVHCPGDPSIMEVNHKDGVKSNYDLDNLEWVTVSENVIHAYKTGLRPDNKPVLVKNLQNGEVERLYSLNECARLFNVNGEIISRYIANRGMYPFKFKYELIFEGQEWRGLTEADIGKVRHGHPQPIIGLHVDSKTLHVFNSMQCAADYIGSSIASVSIYVRDLNKRLLNGYLFWPMLGFKENLENSVIHDKPIPVPIPPKRKPVPVSVFDALVQTSSNWLSVEEFGKSLGVNKNTIQKSILVNNGRWKQYHITYVPSPRNG